MFTNKRILLHQLRCTVHCRQVAHVAKHKIVPNFLLTPVTERAKCVTPHLKNRPPRVLIIGGGLAGLSAAERLRKAGIHDVTILEAQKQLGGRIKSCKMNRTNIELGAYQIEGASVANPIFNLANVECLLCPRTEKRQRKEYTFTTDGKMADDNADAKIWAKNVLNEAATFFTSPTLPSQWNLYDYIDDRLCKVSENLPADAKEKFVMSVNGLMNCLKAKVGEDLKNVSLRDFGSSIDIPGGNVSFPNGTLSLIKPLYNCDVLYGKVVQKICYGTHTLGHRVVVQCCDGSGYCADYAIVTVSLGVLKSLADMMFKPRLPPSKISAIQRIGFGGLTVIFFQYKKPFWNKGENFTMRVSWSKQEIEMSTDWLQGICSITEVAGPDHILKVTVVGKEAEWAEKVNDGRIAEEFTAFLRRVTQDSSLPGPTEVIKSNWCTNIHFYGVKSYLGLGSSVKDQCILAEPLPGPCAEGPPSIMFAGEATIPGYFGSLQGARLSGIREAERIIDLTVELQGAPANPEYGTVQIEPCTLPPPIEPETVCPKTADKEEQCVPKGSCDPCNY